MIKCQHFMSFITVSCHSVVSLLRIFISLQHDLNLEQLINFVFIISVWWGVKFMPGGHSTFFGLLNTFVHIIMYTYYMLAAMGPQVQKYLWWKKYLTMLQMVQFVGIFSHCFQLIFHNPCNFSYIFVWWIGGHGVLFLFLFSNFYKQAYKTSKKESNTSKVLVDDNDNVLEWNRNDSLTQHKALAKHL